MLARSELGAKLLGRAESASLVNLSHAVFSSSQLLKHNFCSTLQLILIALRLTRFTARLGPLSLRTMATSTLTPTHTADCPAAPTLSTNPATVSTPAQPAALPASLRLQPVAEHEKLGGHDFWDSIGKPKFVVAPMVDQSELVSIP